MQIEHAPSQKADTGIGRVVRARNDAEIPEALTASSHKEHSATLSIPFVRASSVHARPLLHASTRAPRTRPLCVFASHPPHKEMPFPQGMQPGLGHSPRDTRDPPPGAALRYLLVFKKQSVNLLKQLAELDPSSMSGPRSRGDEKEKKAPLCRCCCCCCCRLGVPLPPGPSPPRIPSPRAAAAAAAAPRELLDHGREAAGERSREWCCRGPPAAERSSKPWMEEEQKSLLLPLPPGWAIK